MYLDERDVGKKKEQLSAFHQNERRDLVPRDLEMNETNIHCYIDVAFSDLIDM